MAARIRRTAEQLGVPTLASAAALVLVVALAWLTTDEPRIASADTAPSSSATVPDELDRPFSGLPALEALLIDTPAGPTFEPLPPGQDGVGPRTLETLVAAAVAGGQASDDARAGLQLGGFRGGVAKGWLNHADRTAVFISIDEFARGEGARGWAAGIDQGLRGQPSATAVPTDIGDTTATRFDSPASSGVVHQVAYVIRRGRRVVVLKLLSSGDLDVAAAEAHARVQASRLESAAP